MSASDRYQENLQNPKDRGQGAHSFIMSTANLGAFAGLTGNQIFSDIRTTLSAKVPDREINDAIVKALAENHGGNFTPRHRPASIVKDGNDSLHRIIAQAKISDEADLWESSPLRLLDEPERDQIIFLKTLFHCDNFVFIGERREPGIIGQNIRTVAAWLDFFQASGKAGPFIIINPFTGKPAPKKTGEGVTLRGDGNVSTYRYCLVEFDNLNREDQIKFWAAVKLPIVALVDSGNKSVHAWLDVQKLAAVGDAEQWQANIKQRLYSQILTPMGVDGACSNPSRLSRLPGHYREEKEKYQRLLWLSAEGRPIC